MASEGKKIHFQDILGHPENFCGEEVTIRGFLYHTPDGQAILAAEPGLKSCCVGSFGNRTNQIVIPEGKYMNETYRPITVQGKLFSESLGGYRMENASIVIEEGTSLPAGTLAICIILGIFLCGYLWKKFR